MGELRKGVRLGLCVSFSTAVELCGMLPGTGILPGVEARRRDLFFGVLIILAPEDIPLAFAIGRSIFSLFVGIGLFRFRHTHD
jgi:hypothetical protein